MGTLQRGTADVTAGLFELSPAQAATPQPPRVLRIFYYHPADLPPLEGYQPRLEKLLRHTQDFLAAGMGHYGLPASKLRLDSANGKVVIRTVRGRLNLAQHERRKSEASLEADVAQAARQAGIDLSRETVLVFSNLLAWRRERNKELGPYYGRWDASRATGICYAFDDPLLDPDKLSSKEPGGWCVDHPCSIGQFNTHYIGGTIHELGHALGLPHERETAKEREARGLSLMGAGNHTYGQERRGEGCGAFLSKASAYGLTQHPLFREDPAPVVEPVVDWKQLRVTKEGRDLLVTGQLASRPEPFCLTVFADPPGDLDYDSTTDTVSLTADGRFKLRVPELVAGANQARLLLTAKGGGRITFESPFRVGADGSSDLGLLETFPQWEPVNRAWSQGKTDEALRLAAALTERDPSPLNTRRLAILKRLRENAPPTDPAKVPAATKQIALSTLAWSSAEAGWGKPLRDQVLPEQSRTPFLCAGAEIYDRGLYAHAPAKYTFALDGRWDQLETAFGLQDGHGGSVVFVILADGKEVFRSKTIRAPEVDRAVVPVKGAATLTLITEDAGDNAGGDWGLWLNPLLSR